MRGLLIKDLMIEKKLIKNMISVLFFFNTVGVLLYLSFLYGNLSELGDYIGKDNLVYLMVVGNGIYISYALMIITDIFRQDLECDFVKQLVSFPISDKIRTLEKYVLYIIVFMISLIIGISFLSVFGKVAGILHIKKAIKIYLLIACAFGLIDSIGINCMYLFGINVAKVIMLGIIILGSALITIVFNIVPYEKITKLLSVFSWLSDKSALILLLIFIIILPLTYCLSLRIVSLRRNKVW